MRLRSLPLLLLVLPFGPACTVVVRELEGPFDIVQQRVGSVSVEGTGFIDLSEEEGDAYAFGHRYELAGDRFIAILDPPVRSEASKTSLELEEEPLIGLVYDDQDLIFRAREDGEGGVLLVADDPWGTGADLELVLER